MPESMLELIPALPIPPHLVGEVQSKLAYVDEAIVSAQVSPQGDRIVLQLNAAVDTAALEEKVRRVVQSMAKDAIQPRLEVLEDYLDRAVPYRQDPMPELLARREVCQEGQGLFSLGAMVTGLADYFEGRFDALAAFFGARRRRFPTLIPARTLHQLNYFRAFPHSLSFATHLREDLDVIEAFAEQAAYDESLDGLNTPPEAFARIQALLSPAVCYHLYLSLADQTLPQEGLAATAVGDCFRYESINLTSLERMWNFTMWEVIFVGSKEYVLENREKGRQFMQAEFAELGLAYRVESANDPFFIGEFKRQAAFQSAFQLKYEIRARLPFKDSTLAIGSYNYHQDFFGRHMHITLPDGSPAHTGCIAFGLQRAAFAYLAQYGVEPQAWHPAVREAVT
jgi:hypothetical protein